MGRDFRDGADRAGREVCLTSLFKDLQLRHFGVNKLGQLGRIDQLGRGPPSKRRLTMTDRNAQLDKAKSKIETLSNASGPGNDQKVRTGTIRELVGVLKGVTLFSKLPAVALDMLAESANELRLPAGAVIVEEGAAGDSMYVIAAGRAEASVNGKDGAVPVASLVQGDSFGELALVAGGARHASVTALTEISLLVIAGCAFEAMLEAYPAFRQLVAAQAERMLLARFLKQATLFASVPPVLLDELVARICRRSAAAGETVIRQGEVGDRAYLLRSGRVEVLLHGEGEDRVIATLWPGAVFGEAALLSDRPRNATVRATEGCELLVLSRRDVEFAMQGDLAVSEAIVWLLNSRDRPLRIEGIEVHQREGADGAVTTVLKDPLRHAYYRLSEEGWFLWLRLDGQHTLRMLTLDYMAEFKRFAPGVIAQFVAGLAEAGFVRTPGVPSAVARGILARLPI